MTYPQPPEPLAEVTLRRHRPSKDELERETGFVVPSTTSRVVFIYRFAATT